MDPNNKNFKELQKKWYKKLKDAGFHDVEQESWYMDRLAPSKSYENAVERFNSREEYYRLAGQFLHSYKFESNLDKLVWTYHSDGLSVREIAKQLGQHRIRLTRNPVHQIIKRLANIMLKLNRRPREQK